MAEAAVEIVINKAIAAKALLEGEEHLLQENISWIEAEMKTLQFYLKDAQSKNASSFIISIRDLALELEDVLDAHLQEIESRKPKGSFGFLKHPSCILYYGVTDHEFSLKMEGFKRRAAKIEQSKGDIAVESNVDGKFQEKTKKFGKTTFWRKERVKIEERISNDEKECKIISITGPGGVGKTTLVTEIYHQVKIMFGCSAMVYLSKKLTVGDLLIDIAQQVKLEESEMERNLQENLHSFLRKKNYVIFLDDFSHKFDLLIDVVMTNSKKGSRIIVTTREPDQELGSPLVDSIHLEHLSDREGEDLFYDSMDGTPPRDLKSIGDKIVRKCGGLPLAIHVAAGMLKAKERSKRSWNEVLERMSRSVQNDSSNIWELSYQDLPTRLKPFFLYFGIFPMNREIFVPELVRLWVAEKLVIQADVPRKPNKIVGDYIDQLIERNLIQVFKRRFQGKVKSCRIQNLLHEFCTGKAEEMNFFCSWKNLASTARRVIADSSRTNSTIPGKLRALFCFRKGREIAKFIERYASELRFLQVLSIEVEYEAINIPGEIAELSGLIYLKLKGQFITVPSSIRKLKRLQTLEVRSREVPESILKMKNLMHLFISGLILGKKIKQRSDELEVDLPNLETLYFGYQYGYHLSSNSFQKLPSLKQLRVSIAKTQKLDAFCENTPSLEKLEDLKLQVGITSDIPSTMNFSGCQNLKTLYLFFESSNVTCWFEFPKTLVKITLGGIDTEDKDPLEKLKKLPSLKIIKIKNCSTRKIDLSGSDNFPQLETLVLSDTKFQQLVVNEIGMPKLHRFIYKRHQEQPLDLKIPEKLKNVMVNNDDSIRSSISIHEIWSMVGRSWTGIRNLWGGFEVIKRVFGWAMELVF